MKLPEEPGVVHARARWQPVALKHHTELAGPAERRGEIAGPAERERDEEAWLVAKNCGEWLRARGRAKGGGRGESEERVA